MRVSLLGLILSVFLAVALVGCATAPIPCIEAIAIPGDQQWVRTDITLRQGEPFLIEEVPDSDGIRSEVTIRKGGAIFGIIRATVSARGSYTLKTNDIGFPLPSVLDDAPYPAYCLIGRFGEQGRPFYIGPRCEANANASGVLYLGINDPNPSRNTGLFLCKFSYVISPSAPYPTTAPNSGDPAPVADPTVVIFVVDGLRPDVLEEMAWMGHMPNVRDLFLENGTWARNAFTVLPSHTVTSFAAMMTGLYGDSHGAKMQVYYDRRTGSLFDGLSKHAFPRVADAIADKGVKAIYDYFPDCFGAAALPFQRRSPEMVYANLPEFAHRALNASNYASNISDRIDESQTRFALDIVSYPKVRVVMVWLPMVDVASHADPGGQFGRARAAIANADDCIGKIIARLKARGRFDSTYFILASDHGHSAGNGVVNERFDIEREILHKRLQIGSRSYWHNFPFPLAPFDRFAALGDSEGAMELYLPYRSTDSGEMSRANTLKELASYGLADGRGKVNVLDLLTDARQPRSQPSLDGTDKPIDLVLVKVDENTVLVQRSRESQALIRSKIENNEQLFQYVPVKNFSGDGPIEPIRSGDPLQYLDDPAFTGEAPKAIEDWLAEYHNARDWLKATYRTRYPGAVDAMGRFFGHRWGASQSPSDPDLVMFASPGWVFMPTLNLGRRTQPIPGSTHGMAFRQSVNSCLFFSGPGIRRGYVIEEPCRIVDILPTVLAMTSRPFRKLNLDGVPVQGIWEGQP